MEKEQCQAIVELLCVSWDKPQDKQSLLIKAKNYWPFLKEVPFEVTRDTVLDLAVSNRKWIPRPGELRVLALARSQDIQLPPEPEEAWAELQVIEASVQAGKADFDKPHPVIRAAIKKAGPLGNRNSDQEVFTAIYSTLREKYVLQHFGL